MRIGRRSPPNVAHLLIPMTLQRWHREVDATGLLCPLPALKAKRALNQMAPGEVLRVRATDPKAAEDFALLCVQSGHELLEIADDGDARLLYLRCR